MPRFIVYHKKEDTEVIRGVEKLARVQSAVRNESITRSVKIMEYVKKGFKEETK